jgi:ketosteroid isomerase-like protein
MLKQIKARLVLCLLVFASSLAFAQPTQPEDPAHNELRELRKNVIDAITKGDFDRVLTHVHTNVVITWQNNEVCRGQKGLTEFFHRMAKDAFKSYKVPPTPDELTILYGGDTGVSFGETVAQYKILGQDIEMKSRWTATVVKENGRWLLAGYHVSANLLDNPLLNGAKSGLYWAGGVSAAAGLALGLILGKRRGAK